MVHMKITECVQSFKFKTIKTNTFVESQCNLRNENRLSGSLDFWFWMCEKWPESAKLAYILKSHQNRIFSMVGTKNTVVRENFSTKLLVIPEPWVKTTWNIQGLCETKWECSTRCTEFKSPHLHIHRLISIFRSFFRSFRMI